MYNNNILFRTYTKTPKTKKYNFIKQQSLSAIETNNHTLLNILTVSKITNHKSNKLKLFMSKQQVQQIYVWQNANLRTKM